MPVYEVQKNGKTYEVDAPSPQAAASALASMDAPKAPGKSMAATVADTVADVGIGAAKGLGNTVFGLGKAVRDYTPIGRISDAIQPGAFDQKPPEIVPTNTAQRVGYGAEQIGEFFVPTGMAGQAAKFTNPAKWKLATQAAEVARSGALTYAQTGSPTAAGVSAGLTAVIPGAGAVQRLTGKLETGAAKGVMQALGPTKERYKAIAERLTPEILKRGLRGSRESLQAKAAETLETVGLQLDDALTKFGTQPISTAPITTALETAKDAFRTTAQKSHSAVLAENAKRAKMMHGPAPIQILSPPDPAGMVSVAVEFEPRAIKQLSGLQTIIADLGDTATVDQLVAIRRSWDKVVSQAGGFAQRSGGAIGVPLKDQSEAWAKREATGAIRKVLETDVPDLAVINKEWSFWKNLDDVLTQTLQRTQPHGPGLLKQGAETAGQMVGGVAGSGAGPAGAVGGAFALGKLSKMAQTVFTSPRWRLASAQTKDALAEAIATNNMGKIAATLSKITTAVPGRVAVQGK